MCRRGKLRGWCTVCFGLGLALGHSIESWFFCCCGGFFLILFGLILVGKN